MFKPRVALLGVLALFIASGIAMPAASAGQGPFWHVNGSKLGQGVAKQVKLQAKGSIVFKWDTSGKLGAKIVIECHRAITEGATIEGQGNFQGQDKGRLVFEQCVTINEPAGECKIVEPIQFNQTKSYLAYNPNNKQQKFVDVFEPQQGTTFVVFHFTGKGCVLTEAQEAGAVAAEIMPIEKESQELLFVFPETPIKTVIYQQQERQIELKFWEVPSILTAAYGARLATNEPWGVFGQ